MHWMKSPRVLAAPLALSALMMIVGLTSPALANIAKVHALPANSATQTWQEMNQPSPVLHQNLHHYLIDEQPSTTPAVTVQSDSAQIQPPAAAPEKITPLTASALSN